MSEVTDPRSLSTEEDEGSERKTLQQQLKENRERKQREYQEQLAAKNSTYKLDEKSAQFYEELRAKELAKENLHKQQERQQLEKFRSLKSAASYKAESGKQVSTTPPTISSSAPSVESVSGVVENVESGSVKKATPTIVLRKRSSQKSVETAPPTKLAKSEKHAEKQVPAAGSAVPEQTVGSKVESLLGDYSSDED